MANMVNTHIHTHTRAHPISSYPPQTPLVRYHPPMRHKAPMVPACGMQQPFQPAVLSHPMPPHTQARGRSALHGRRAWRQCSTCHRASGQRPAAAAAAAAQPRCGRQRRARADHQHAGPGRTGLCVQEQCARCVHGSARAAARAGGVPGAGGCSAAARCT